MKVSFHIYSCCLELFYTIPGLEWKCSFLSQNSIKITTNIFTEIPVLDPTKCPLSRDIDPTAAFTLNIKTEDLYVSLLGIIDWTMRVILLLLNHLLNVS